MKPGDVRTLGTQRYECVGVGEPYTNRFGRTVLLHPIESRCPDCGRRFRLQTTDRGWRKGELTRRCAEHRRPGVAVKPGGRVRPGGVGRKKAPPPLVEVEAVDRLHRREEEWQWPQSLLDLVE